MSIYLGFDLKSMLYWLNRYCKLVEIHKQGELWRLYVLSDEYGEFENVGGLFCITTQAFKPFIEKANKDTTKMKDLLNTHTQK